MHVGVYTHTHTHCVILRGPTWGLPMAVPLKGLQVSLRAGLATEDVKVRTYASVCAGVCHMGVSLRPESRF